MPQQPSQWKAPTRGVVVDAGVVAARLTDGGSNGFEAPLGRDPGGCRVPPDGALRSAPGGRGARRRRSRGFAGADRAHGLLVGSLVEDFWGAADFVPGEEARRYGARSQALLLVGTDMFGHHMPDVDGAGGADFTAL